MSYGPIGYYTDPWTQQKALQAQRTLARAKGMGQTPPSTESAEPPPPKKMPVGLMVGWSVLLVASAGIFYAVTSGAPTKRVRANRRRSSRRRKPRRLKYAAYALTKAGNWIEKSRHRTLRAAEDAAEKLYESRRYRAVGADDAGKTFFKMSPNRGRRRSSRRPKKNLRRYKALSAAARRRMPASSFVFPDRGKNGAWPIKGPPGSGRERDKWQALQAIRYLHMGRVANRSDYLSIRNAIIREYGKNFWRKYDGPSWNKVEKAKRKRSRSRRRQSSRRKVAANRRRR